MEIYKLSNKEFRIILLREISKLQEHKDGKLNKIKEMRHEQNEKFVK